MRVSLKWLENYVAVPSDLKAFCDRLDLTGTGVEGVERTGDAFDHVVTGVVLEKEAQILILIICGLPRWMWEKMNPSKLCVVLKTSTRVTTLSSPKLAPVLPGDFKIKKSKLRGVVSMGMNCSARELGIGSDHDGIMILPPDAPVGVPFADYMKLADTVLDLEITPNRPDCLSMVGMAREVGAMYQEDFENPLSSMAAELHEDPSLPKTADLATVEIADANRASAIRHA